MPTIHPTAIISPEARLAPDVKIGPYCIIDGPVTLGEATELKSHVTLLGRITLGKRNLIHPHAVLGDFPQDRKYDPKAPSEIIIGDDNIIREAVTIHRGTGPNTKTIIGSRCYLMVNSHVGHNCHVSDDVTLVNNSLLGGHVHVGAGAIIGGGSAIHQFCRIGRLSMISNASCHNVDIPPFFIAMLINHVAQLNVVGLRRNGIPRENISALRELFRFIRSRRMTRQNLEQVPKDLLAFPEVNEWLNFCRESKRGVATFQSWSSRTDITAASTDDDAIE